MPDLSGAVAIVTGASRGVGRGVAAALADAGATVHVTGRTLTDGRDGNLARHRADHAHDAETEAVVETVIATEGRLDILVNNAWPGYERMLDSRTSTNVNTRELYPTSQLLSAIVGFDVQPNKAIVGRNAFAHEAGIHQHGVINNPLCYEIMTPESVGVTNNLLVLGKHSGRHALGLRYEEIGYSLTAAELEAAYGRFTELADRKKRIYDQDLISLIAGVANLEELNIECVGVVVTTTANYS